MEGAAKKTHSLSSGTVTADQAGSNTKMNETNMKSPSLSLFLSLF